MPRANHSYLKVLQGVSLPPSLRRTWQRFSSSPSMGWRLALQECSPCPSAGLALLVSAVSSEPIVEVASECRSEAGCLVGSSICKYFLYTRYVTHHTEYVMSFDHYSNTMW